MSKSTEYDEDGYAIPGTHAISVVTLGAWKADGTPMPTVTSAVCDRCSDWASNVWFAGETRRATEDFLADVRVSRTVTVTVYACPEHSEDVVNELVAEYGFCSNAHDVDKLAQKVDRAQRSERRREATQ